MNHSVSELDFFEYKNQLITFLKSQERFKGFNFEGTNFNVMLDVLAYNTYHNNFYNNMALNEVFLDSAQLKDSVVSHAKTLNYVPRSRYSAMAVLNLVLSVNDNPSFINVPAKTKFIAQCGNKTYDFYTIQTHQILPDTNGIYQLTNLEVYEGRWVKEIFIVEERNQKFILSNDNINMNSIRVKVYANATDDDNDEYVYRTSIFGTQPTDQIFMLLGRGNKYEVTFGNDVFGVKPVIGNKIEVEYMVTAGEEANGIASFSLAGNVRGYPGTCYLVSQSEGGAERETVESIKYFAPRSVQVQDRAVTANDFEILLMARFPEIQAVSVFGGETLDPPRFGKIIIAVDTNTGEGVSQNNINRYTEYLKDRTPVTVKPIVITPKFMYYNVISTVYFNSKISDLARDDIADIVTNTITDYSNVYLNKFNATLEVSRLSNDIDNSNKSVISNELKINPIIPIRPVNNIIQNFNASFEMEIQPNSIAEGDSSLAHIPSLYSSSFTYKKLQCYLMDNGRGIIHIVRNENDVVRYVARGIGTIDYATGGVVLNQIILDDYVGSDIKLFANPKFQTITSPKDRIGVIRRNDIKVSVVVK